ncbi:MAG: hypothetical protein GF355_10395 [Candidatus Eisenbacteria bacterium]|nr:hypothetical protein [Candidatus Eisenbacteria bacterium]
MDSLQTELNKSATPLEIQILGVNETGHESGNGVICHGRDLPWLQDTEEERVWERWEFEYRDVVILDPENVPVLAYNLTDHNLADPAHFDSLRSLLIETAEHEAR